MSMANTDNTAVFQENGGYQLFKPYQQFERVVRADMNRKSGEGPAAMDWINEQAIGKVS